MLWWQWSLVRLVTNILVAPGGQVFGSSSDFSGVGADESARGRYAVLGIHRPGRGLTTTRTRRGSDCWTPADKGGVELIDSVLEKVPRTMLPALVVQPAGQPAFFQAVPSSEPGQAVTRSGKRRGGEETAVPLVVC